MTPGARGTVILRGRADAPKMAIPPDGKRSTASRPMVASQMAFGDHIGPDSAVGKTRKPPPREKFQFHNATIRSSTVP